MMMIIKNLTKVVAYYSVIEYVIVGLLMPNSNFNLILLLYYNFEANNKKVDHLIFKLL